MVGKLLEIIENPKARSSALLAAGLALSTAAAIAPYAASSGLLLVSKGAPAMSLMAMLEGRSPGERTAGELADTKARHAAPFRSASPHQRALAKVRQPDAFPKAFTSSSTASQAPVAISSPDQLALQVFQPGLIPRPGTASPLAPPSPASGSSGIGGGGIAPPSAPAIGIAPTEVAPAIPEPSSWAMMLLGFGAVGYSLRRRRDAALRMPIVERERFYETGRMTRGV